MRLKGDLNGNDGEDTMEGFHKEEEKYNIKNASSVFTGFYILSVWVWELSINYDNGFYSDHWRRIENRSIENKWII
jgi:hypothetical protein